MIITRTPYRVSFMGGGTDYRQWYEEHGGAVLSTTIDRYCYILARRMPAFLGARYRIFYAKSECVNEIAEIQHPAVRACLEHVGMREGFELNHAGDLPARSGLGSSSAFTVGVLHALHALQGRHVTKPELAAQAVHLEQDVMRETVGIQDQVACAYGGLNVIEIDRGGRWAVHPVVMTAARRAAFQAHCMLYFTGIQRHASGFAAAQVASLGEREAQMKEIAALVRGCLSVLTGGGDLAEFGRLLRAGWELKRALSPMISTPWIDELYARAMGAGALGGKLLGAGGGGFLLLFVRPEDQPGVRLAMGDAIEAPFGFETGGSRIVYAEG